MWLELNFNISFSFDLSDKPDKPLPNMINYLINHYQPLPNMVMIYQM